MSHLYFNEESCYSEENTTCDNDASGANLLHTVLEQEISIGANAERNRL